MVKIGINGFGHIKRNVFRAALNNKEVAIVAINDLNDVNTLAQIRRTAVSTIEAGESALYVNGKKIKVFAERDPASSTIDTMSTMVVGDNLVKVVSWYDDQWGYSNRIVDLATFIASKGI